LTDDLDNLSPEKLEAAIARLEAEKLRRTEGKPSPAIERTERHVVDPSDNDIIRNADQPPVSKSPPRRRRKPREVQEPSTPTPFFTVVAKPRDGDCGAIEESWFTQDGDTVCLCDAAGHATGERRKVERDSPLWTARQLLRSRLAERKPGPNHDPITYPKTGWR
jgi:hypothetical protein